MRKAETRVFPSIKIWLLIAVLAICGTTSFASCSSNEDNSTEQSNITNIADKVWAFSQSHPDGFTIDIRTMTEPTEGIAVSYAATQNSHSRDQLDKVVSHALQHEGYVGGCYNSEDGLYYFDSTKLFPESDLKGAVQFGKENGQYSVFILSTYTDIPLDGKVAEIIERGTILFGTTGDYRPLSFREAERNKRATILTSEGQKAAAILQSEGQKTARINQAEADKQTEILRAEGEAQARIRRAEAEAIAVDKITEAVGKSTNPAHYLLAQKYIGMLEEVATGDKTKTVYLPYEATNLMGSIGGIKDLFKSE